MRRSATVLLETVNAIALGLWSGALVTVGIAAAIAFPMVRDMDARLPALAGYEGEHWRIIAGAVMNRLFSIVDFAGVVLLLIAMVCLALLMLMRRARRPGVSDTLRVASLVGCAALLFGTIGVLRPRMDQHVRDHREQAEAGHQEAAERARDAFDELHGPASNLHAAQLVLVLLALGSSVSGALLREERSA